LGIGRSNYGSRPSREKPSVVRGEDHMFDSAKILSACLRPSYGETPRFREAEYACRAAWRHGVSGRFLRRKLFSDSAKILSAAVDKPLLFKYN